MKKPSVPSTSEGTKIGFATAVAALVLLYMGYRQLTTPVMSQHPYQFSGETGGIPEFRRIPQPIQDRVWVQRPEDGSRFTPISGITHDDIMFFADLANALVIKDGVSASEIPMYSVAFKLVPEKYQRSDGVVDTSFTLVDTGERLNELSEAYVSGGPIVTEYNTIVLNGLVIGFPDGSVYYGAFRWNKDGLQPMTPEMLEEIRQNPTAYTGIIPETIFIGSLTP